MYKLDRLWLTGLTVERLPTPLGIDIAQPRFSWKLHSQRHGVGQPGRQRYGRYGSGNHAHRGSTALDCGLTHAETSQETPSGWAAVEWELVDGKACVKAKVPVNTTEGICLPGMACRTVGSGRYSFIVEL